MPLITVLEPAYHPLAIEQQCGITTECVLEFAHLILHEKDGG